METLDLVHRRLRLAFLALVLVIGLLGYRAYGYEREQTQQQEIEFDQHWLRYLLAEHGCPLNQAVAPAVVAPVLASDCTGQGMILASEKARARELAKSVFGLAEPVSPRTGARH